MSRPTVEDSLLSEAHRTNSRRDPMKVRNTQTYPLRFHTAAGELAQWMSGLPEDASISVQTTLGDRNESASYSLEATWMQEVGQ